MAARGRHLLDSGASSDETGMVVAATPASNSTAEAELTQASFDTNMIIILAALLCALICALGLNSFVRCVLRCARPQTTPHASDAGLRKSALRKIPVIVFGSDPGRGVGPDCPICLGEFVEGEKVRILPGCNHGFHVGCIDTWLGAHSSCPNCRHSLVGAVGSSSKAAAADAAATPWSGGGGPEHVVVEVNS